MGEHASAIAIAARWRIPPENSCGYRSARSPAMPTSSSSSLTRARASLPCASPWVSIGSAIWSPIVLTGLNAFIAPWKTIETSFHRCGLIDSSPRARMSSPLRITFPETEAVGGSRPIIARMVVVLPQPDSPTRPRRSPSRRSKLTPWTAWSSPPPCRSNQTWRSSTLTTGSGTLTPRPSSHPGDEAGTAEPTDGRPSAAG